MEEIDYPSAPSTSQSENDEFFTAGEMVCVCCTANQSTGLMGGGQLAMVTKKNPNEITYKLARVPDGRRSFGKLVLDSKEHTVSDISRIVSVIDHLLFTQDENSKMLFGLPPLLFSPSSPGTPVSIGLRYVDKNAEHFENHELRFGDLIENTRTWKLWLIIAFYLKGTQVMVMARRFNFDETLESITPVRQMDLGIESLSLVTDLFSCGILRLYEEEDDATAEDRARKAENALDCVTDHVLGHNEVDESSLVAPAILEELRQMGKKTAPLSTSPPKSSNAKASRGPGRPRKVEQEKMHTPPKPRGRPRKVVGEPVSDNEVPSALKVVTKKQPKKRKRGDDSDDDDGDGVEKYMELAATISNLNDEIGVLNKRIKKEMKATDKAQEEVKSQNLSHQKELQALEERLAKKGEELQANDVKLKLRIRELEKKIATPTKPSPQTSVEAEPERQTNSIEQSQMGLEGLLLRLLPSLVKGVVSGLQDNAAPSPSPVPQYLSPPQVTSPFGRPTGPPAPSPHVQGCMCDDCLPHVSGCRCTACVSRRK